MRSLAPLLLLLACSACAQNRAPHVDPVAVDRLLVRLEAQQTGPVEELLPEKTEAKLNRADRLVAPLEKIGAEKIDPQVALAFVGG